MTGRVSRLAQVNVARLRAPLDDPSMRDVVDALDGIHRLAEGSRGFVWRLGTGTDHGLTVVTDDAGPAFLNLSVWEDYASLHEFVYRTAHGGSCGTAPSGSTRPGSRPPRCGGSRRGPVPPRARPRGGSGT